MRKFVGYFLPLVFLLAPLFAQAAITLDATSSNYVSSGTSINTTLSVSSSNEMVVACIYGQYSTSPATPTVTYGGVTMSTAWMSLGTQFGGWEPGIFYLYNPPTGSNTLTVSWGQTMSGQSVIASSWQGTASYIGATSTALNRTATPSVTNTTIYANSDDIDCAAYNVIATLAPSGTNQALLKLDNTNGNRDYMSSYQTTTSPGSYTMSWSGGSGTPAWYDNVLELPIGSSTTSGAPARPSMLEIWGGFFRQLGGSIRIY